MPLFLIIDVIVRLINTKQIKNNLYHIQWDPYILWIFTIALDKLSLLPYNVDSSDIESMSFYELF